MLNAIQQGIFTPSTKERLEALEREKKRVVRADNQGRNEQTKTYKGTNSVLDIQIQKAQPQKIRPPQTARKQLCEFNISV